MRRQHLVFDEWSLVLRCLETPHWVSIACVSPMLDHTVVLFAVEMGIQPAQLVASPPRDKHVHSSSMVPGHDSRAYPKAADHRHAHTLIAAARWGLPLYPLDATSFSSAMSQIGHRGLAMTIDVTHASSRVAEQVIEALAVRGESWEHLTLAAKNKPLPHHIRSLILALPQLHGLEVSRTDVDDDFILAVAQRHPSLYRLNVFDCKNVTDLNPCASLRQLSIGGIAVWTTTASTCSFICVNCPCRTINL
jgi:hypothetical protein